MTEDSTIEFYNQESTQYSKKRYEGKTETYFQFLFKCRRRIFLRFISDISTLLVFTDALEIGCADGVIVKKLLQDFPRSFKSVVGLDISPKMIEIARQTTNDSRARYFMRGEEPESKYDLVVELGVHAHDFEAEMSYVSDKLNYRGYFLYSAAGKGSIHSRIKLGDKKYAEDYLNYSEYEEIIKKYFEIVDSCVYGLFIPKLWSIPFIARVAQPFIEAVFRNILPSLYHEKIYLLQKKS